MLFAAKYRPRKGRTDAESRRVRAVLIKWAPPEGVVVKQHYHYISGGGVVIFEAENPGDIYEAMEPFRFAVGFDIEPVINLLEAVAISMDIEEWAASTVADAPAPAAKQD